jgi:uncharacterized protein YcfJ
MSTSPLSPEDVRAAAETHRELGPEYSDAVVASFLDRVDREVAARVDARLANTAVATPAKPDDRRTLLKGMAVGALAGGMVIAAVGGFAGRSSHAAHVPAKPPHQVNMRVQPLHHVIELPWVPAQPAR